MQQFGFDGFLRVVFVICLIGAGTTGCNLFENSSAAPAPASVVPVGVNSTSFKIDLVDSNSATGTNQIVISGSGIKGPLAFANYSIYELDTTQPDYYNITDPIVTATTNAYAVLGNYVSHRAAKSLPFVIVVDATQAIDLTTNTTPVITVLKTIITQSMLASGQPIYATPLTTLAFEIATLESGTGISSSQFEQSIAHAATLIESTIGNSVADDIDIMTSPPIINAFTTTPEQQQAVAEHRALIEAFSAIMYHMVQDAAESVPPLNANDLIKRLARDLESDGVINNTESGAIVGEINPSYFTVNMLGIEIPNTDFLVADIVDVLAMDMEVTGFTNPLLRDQIVLPAMLGVLDSDIDGDGIPNAQDTTTVYTSGTIRIEAEDYAAGGEGIAYHDTTSGNNGGVYKSENVDIQDSGDIDGGYNVGWIAPNEWLNYEVNVPESGNYNIGLRVARQLSGASAMHIKLNGNDITGLIEVPSTGDWQQYTTVIIPGISLQAGRQVMTLYFNQGNFNINWVKLEPQISTDLNNHRPLANPGGPYTATVGNSIMLNGSSSYDADGDLLSYSWDFGDGSVFATGEKPAHIYMTPGTYSIRLTVNDGEVDSVTTTTTVTVSSAPVSQPIDQSATSGSTGTPSSTGVNNNVSTPSLSNLTPSGPITISGNSNVVVSGLKISNPSGNCIVIDGGAAKVTIENSEIGPCGKMGVYVKSSSDVLIRNVYIHDTTDVGIEPYLSQRVTIKNNRIENVMSGVYAIDSTAIDVNNNSFKNVQGPFPRGQFVQFNRVTGYGNRINDNIGINVLGESYAEDAISVFSSYGMPDDPIQVNRNRIKGGGPSGTGGGIMTGDGGSSYIVAEGNIIVDPGQYGIAVSGGHDISLLNNLVYGKQQSFTNVGLYVWNWKPETTICHTITVRGNKVNWTRKDGVYNPAWNGGGNCGVIEGWNQNDWKANFDETIFNQ